LREVSALTYPSVGGQFHAWVSNPLPSSPKIRKILGEVQVGVYSQAET